jgi:eukaryotic-like serine/threonine-protein kinase
MPARGHILPDRYRDARRIGSGGMGEIYRTTDTVLGRTVAVKLLAERYAQDESVRGRFTREALAAARLSGEPSIVTIFDVGEHEQRPFIVMEYLGGGSLEERLRSGRVDTAQSVEWLREAARALDYAHAEGVVHRDVKPANLLLDREGHVHVADFGIASAAGLDSFTKPGTVLGTAGYLSPEQAEGERATPASDRYGLGVVAFELLAGSRPFAAETPTAEAMAHVSTPVPSISKRNPSVPPELDEVFERALAKDPEARFPSCAEFVSCIENALAEAAGTTHVVAATPPAPTAATRPLRRDAAEPPRGPARGPTAAPAQQGPPPRRRPSAWPWVVATVVAALLVGGAALAALIAGGGDEAAESDRATATAPSTFVTTVVTTAQGTTVRETVTATTPAEPPPPPETEPQEPGGGGGGGGGGGAAGRSVEEGIRLTDASTALIRGGDYEAALPLAQQALSNLQGSGHIYEAYANYNVGKSLLETGDCAGALPYFDRSEQIQGERSEITRDRAAAQACA